jgi:hypothetical protein
MLETIRDTLNKQKSSKPHCLLCPHAQPFSPTPPAGYGKANSDVSFQYQNSLQNILTYAINVQSRFGNVRLKPFGSRQRSSFFMFPDTFSTRLHRWLSRKTMDIYPWFYPYRVSFGSADVFVKQARYVVILGRLRHRSFVHDQIEYAKH